MTKSKLNKFAANYYRLFEQAKKQFPGKNCFYELTDDETKLMYFALGPFPIDPDLVKDKSSISADSMELGFYTGISTRIPVKEKNSRPEKILVQNRYLEVTDWGNLSSLNLVVVSPELFFIDGTYPDKSSDNCLTFNLTLNSGSVRNPEFYYGEMFQGRRISDWQNEVSKLEKIFSECEAWLKQKFR